MILNGRRALAPLLQEFAVLGLGEEQIDALLREDFIRLVGDAAATGVLAASRDAADHFKLANDAVNFSAF